MVCTTVAGAEAPTTVESALYGRLREFHKGAGACLRYVDGSVDELLLRATARQLLASGVDAETLRKVMLYFAEKAVEAEKRAHKISEREEFHRALMQTMSALEKEAVAKNPNAFEAVLDKLSARPSLETKESAAFFASMNKQQKMAINEVWRAHPLLLTIHHFSDLRRALEVEEAADVLRKAGEFVLGYFAKEGRYPEVLPSNLAGRGVRYYARKGGAVLTSATLPESSWVEVRAGVLHPYTPAPCVSQIGRSIKRGEFQKWVDDSGAGLSGIRIIPAFDDKQKARGFKIFDFAPETLLVRMGFCEGDIVLGAGPFTLNSPENVFKAYAELKEKPKVTFTLERGGRPFTLEVTQAD